MEPVLHRLASERSNAYFACHRRIFEAAEKLLVGRRGYIFGGFGEDRFEIDEVGNNEIVEIVTVYDTLTKRGVLVKVKSDCGHKRMACIDF